MTGPFSQVPQDYSPPSTGDRSRDAEPLVNDKKIRSFEKRLENSEGNFNAQQRIVTSLCSDLNQYATRVSVLETSRSTLKDQRGDIRETQELLIKDNSQLKEKNGQLKEKNEQLEGQIQSLSESIERLNGVLEVISERLSACEAINAELVKEKEEKEQLARLLQKYPSVQLQLPAFPPMSLQPPSQMLSQPTSQPMPDDGKFSTVLRNLTDGESMSPEQIKAAKAMQGFEEDHRKSLGKLGCALGVPSVPQLLRVQTYVPNPAPVASSSEGTPPLSPVSFSNSSSSSSSSLSSAFSEAHLLDPVSGSSPSSSSTSSCSAESNSSSSSSQSLPPAEESDQSANRQKE